MPEALSGPHQIRTYAVIYQRPWPRNPAWVGAVSPFAWAGTQIGPALPVETGTVTIDDTGIQRRRANVTVAPTSGVLPTSVYSALTPFRNLVLLYYAVGTQDNPLPPYGSGAVPSNAYLLGTFVLTDVDVDLENSGDVKITMDLQDLSQDISRRVLLKPYVTNNGILMTRAVQELLEFATSSGLQSLPYFVPDANPALTSGGEGPDTLYAAGYTWDEGQDPWQAAQQMSEACGMQLYFGPAGATIMSYIPNPAATPTCWSYVSGLAPNPWVNGVGYIGPMLTSCKRTFSQSQVFNFVEYVVEGANANPSPDLLYTGTSFLAQIGDEDPQSPTNVNGPYGVAGDVQFDQINYQQSVALVAAKARLRRDLGAADMVTFTAMPNPAHEAYDVISVQAPEIGLNQLYVIDTVELPLDAGKDMTVTARRVVNVP